MNINPMQMLGMFTGKTNPMQMLMNQMGSNPLFKQAQQMSQGKTPEQLEQTCRNLCKQRGIDYDSAMSQFQSQFGLK